MKRRTIIRLLIAAVLIGLVWCFLHSFGPPKETRLIRNFHAHRASFEKIRDMLEADTHLRRLAHWGVETDKGILDIKKPPEGDFPLERYNQYLALLRETGGKLAARGQGTNAAAIVTLWASGFGGDTVHVGVIWLNEAPARQVASLDEHYRHPNNSVGDGWVYQHIDQNWYLYTDISTK